MDIFQDSLFRDLEKLNFTVNESKVYLALLRLGPSWAGNVSKTAMLDRSSTYNALQALINRGVVGTMHQSKRTVFVPQDPQQLLNYYREKEEIARQIIPSLKEQYKGHKGKQTVTLFNGYKGLKTVFEDILSHPGVTNYVLGSEGQFAARMPYYSPHFKLRMREQGVSAKSLIRDARLGKKSSKGNEYRLLKTKTVSPATLNIYADKVAIFLWSENPEAILIENRDLAQSFKEYFELLWQQAKKT